MLQEFEPDPYDGRDDEGPEAALFRARASLPDSWEAKHLSRCLLCHCVQVLKSRDGEVIGQCTNPRCKYEEYLGGSRREVVES